MHCNVFETIQSYQGLLSPSKKRRIYYNEELNRNHLQLLLGVNESFMKRLDLEAALEYHEGCVNTVAWNDQGTILVSGSDDCKLNIWDYGSKKIMASIATGHTGNIFCARFLPFTGDNQIISCAADGEVRFVDINRSARNPMNAALSAGTRRRRGLGAAASARPSSSNIEINDAYIRVFNEHSGMVHKLDIEPGSPYVFLTASKDGTARQYDLRIPGAQNDNVIADLRRGRAGRRSFRDHSIEIEAISINPMNPNYFIIGGGDEYMRLYDRRMHSNNNSALCRCVYRFAPRSIVDNASNSGSIPLHITGVRYNAYGTEVVSTYSGEDIYKFSAHPSTENYNDKKRCYGSCALSTSSAASSSSSSSNKAEGKATRNKNKKKRQDEPAAPEQTTSNNNNNNEATKTKEEDTSAVGTSSNNNNNNESEVAKEEEDLEGGFKETERAPHEIELPSSPTFDDSDDELESSDSDSEGEEEYIEEDFGFGGLSTDDDESDKDEQAAESDEGRQSQSQTDDFRARIEEGMLCTDYLMKYQGHRNIRTVKEVNFMGPHSEYVISGSDCGHIFIWESATGKVVNVIKGDSYVVNCLSPHPHHLPILATSGIDHEVKLWSPFAPEQTKLENLDEIISRNRQLNSEGHHNMLMLPSSMILNLLNMMEEEGAILEEEEEEEEEGAEETEEGEGGRRRRRAGAQRRVRVQLREGCSLQ